MVQMPLISVILPFYNEPETIAVEAIDSILQQTYTNTEIILLLDNPENEVLKRLIFKYAAHDTRVKVYINEKNVGLPKTLNIGIDLATGEYIARMDGDDISVAERLNKQLRYLLLNPNIDLIGSNTYVINEEGNLVGEYHKLKSDYSQKMMLRYVGINMIHPTWFGRANLFKKCRYRNFSHCEDYDFMLRAYALGYKFNNIQENLLFCRIQQTSLRSISRKYAYEQYVNTIRARAQFLDFKKRKMQSYPVMPQFVYDSKDKEKYLRVIPQLNQLREAFFSKKIFRIIALSFSIAVKDYRPLTSRSKVLFLSKILELVEKVTYKLKSIRLKNYFHK